SDLVGQHAMLAARRWGHDQPPVAQLHPAPIVGAVQVQELLYREDDISGGRSHAVLQAIAMVSFEDLADASREPLHGKSGVRACERVAFAVGRRSHSFSIRHGYAAVPRTRTAAALYTAC